MTADICTFNDRITPYYGISTQLSINSIYSIGNPVFSLPKTKTVFLSNLKFTIDLL